jgi:biopolymer transport protein ExbB/TolQ
LIVIGIISVLILIADEGEDIAGVISLGLMLTFTSLVIAVFAAVLQKLLKNAIDIKSENDLTV